MIFQPVALIASIVVFVRRVASVKVYKEFSALECSWAFFEGSVGIYLGRVPFGSSRSRDFVRDDE